MFVLCYAVIKPQEGGQDKSAEENSSMISFRHQTHTPKGG